MVIAEEFTATSGTETKYEMSSNDNLLNANGTAKGNITINLDNMEANYYKLLLGEDIQLLTSTSKSPKPEISVTDMESSDTNSTKDLDEVGGNSEFMNSYRKESVNDNIVTASVDDCDQDNDDASDVSDLSDDKSAGMLPYTINPQSMFANTQRIPSKSRQLSKQYVPSSTTKPKSLKSIVSKKGVDATSTATPFNASDDDNKIFEFDFRVAFRDVTVRKYAFILGDNPACSNGPSLSISWDYHSEETYAVDEFEYRRDDLYSKDLIDIAMSAKTRLTIVRNLGYSADEIKVAIADIHAIRAHRMITAKKNLVQKTGKVFLTVKLKLNKIIGINNNTNSSSRKSTIDKVKLRTQFSVSNQAA